MCQDFALTPLSPDHTISPESSDGFASVGTILPKEKAALLPGGLFVFRMSGFVAANARPLDVIEQGHEAEVHVQLLVAVEQSEAGVIRNEVNLRLLVATNHHHIFDHS